MEKSRELQSPALHDERLTGSQDSVAGSSEKLKPHTHLSPRPHPSPLAGSPLNSFNDVTGSQQESLSMSSQHVSPKTSPPVQSSQNPESSKENPGRGSMKTSTCSSSVILPPSS